VETDFCIPPLEVIMAKVPVIHPESQSLQATRTVQD
jgi:hypothetical protein